MPYTDEDIDSISAFYEAACEIIPLGNWRTTLLFCTKKDMEHHTGFGDDYGCLEHDRSKHIADIYLNIDHDPVSEYERWETTVIHELLRVVIDDLAEYIETKHPKMVKDDMYGIKMERVVNVMTLAIYNSLSVGTMAKSKQADLLDVATQHNSEVA